MERILIVEDEVDLNNAIVRLMSKSAECDSAFDGDRGLALAEKGIYDLVLLDMLLPKKNGIEVLELLRRTSNCSVIILMPTDDVNNRIKCLRLGADDCIAKPFYDEELVARCEAVLRRYSNVFGEKVYSFKGLDIDFKAKRVSYCGETLPIVGKQYEILEYLVRNKDIVLPKEQIFNRIWGFASDTVTTVIDVYISKMRKLIEEFSGLNNCIQTIKKVGYMWTDKN